MAFIYRCFITDTISFAPEFVFFHLFGIFLGNIAKLVVNFVTANRKVSV